MLARGGLAAGVIGVIGCRRDAPHAVPTHFDDTVEVVPPPGAPRCGSPAPGTSRHQSSIGGALYVDNSGSTGAGAVLCSNRGADALGRLLVVNQANPANPQHAVRIQNVGHGHTVSVFHDPAAGAGDPAAEAVDIVSTNELDTTLGVRGRETGKGTVKITHGKPAGARRERLRPLDRAGGSGHRRAGHLHRKRRRQPDHRRPAAHPQRRPGHRTPPPHRCRAPRGRARRIGLGDDHHRRRPRRRHPRDLLELPAPASPAAAARRRGGPDHQCVRLLLTADDQRRRRVERQQLLDGPHRASAGQRVDPEPHGTRHPGLPGPRDVELFDAIVRPGRAHAPLGRVNIGSQATPGHRCCTCAATRASTAH